MQSRHLSPVLIAIFVLALYGGFLYSPLVFDDFSLLSPEYVKAFLNSVGFYPRHLVYSTLALTWEWKGGDLLFFSIPSLLLHAATSIALFYFLLQLQKALLKDVGERSILLPLLAASVFALHPAAVYAAAYLIQRTTVMATLFALMSWTSFLYGLRSNKQGWLWCSVVMYGLCVLCKEHAILVPGVHMALALWWWRNESSRPSAAQLLRQLLWVALACGLIMVMIWMLARRYVGVAYEPDVPTILKTDHVWAVSVITQAFLFFKYIALWLLPNPLWMSVDMREPFAQTVMAWPYVLGFALFLVWPIVACWLLWKGGRRGLIGFSMISPWLLFGTEIATVRIQEIFVLYRSYLWLAPSFALFLVLDKVLSNKAIKYLVVIVPLMIFPLGLNRLTTFSHPLLLWDDAARLAEASEVDKAEGVTGLRRIYYNRGIELVKVNKYELAVDDFTKAIGYDSAFYLPYHDRGATLVLLHRYEEALPDFDTALRLNPNYARSMVGKAQALEALGRTNGARENYLKACQLNFKYACKRLPLLH